MYRCSCVYLIFFPRYLVGSFLFKSFNNISTKDFSFSFQASCSFAPMKIATISRGTGNNIVEFFSEIFFVVKYNPWVIWILLLLRFQLTIGIFGRIHWYVWLKKKKSIKTHSSYDTDWMLSRNETWWYGNWWCGTWWYRTWWYGVQSLEISKLHRRRRLLYHARGLPGCNNCYHQPLFVFIGTMIIIIITINIMIILRSRQETFLRAFDARISPSAAITWTSQLFQTLKNVDTQDISYSIAYMLHTPSLIVEIYLMFSSHDP